MFRLHRAIALSLKQAGKSSLNAIEISDDSDDDESFQADLQRAVTASKSGSSTNFSQGSSSTALPAATPATNPFLAERAQLERARLERQKRLRKELSQSEDPHAAKRRHVAGTSATSNATPSPTSSRASSPSARSSPSNSVPAIPEEQMFLEGELRPVANMHANPRKDGRPTFRLTEILGQVCLLLNVPFLVIQIDFRMHKKIEIAFAVLSSYALVMSWIYEFLDPSTPVIMVAQPDQSGNATIKNVFPNWIRTTPFLRNGRGCMHMKVAQFPSPSSSISEINAYMHSPSSCLYAHESYRWNQKFTRIYPSSSTRQVVFVWLYPPPTCTLPIGVISRMCAGCLIRNG
jgi:tyrosyl-DNA phosphodiesterase-1